MIDSKILKMLAEAAEAAESKKEETDIYAEAKKEAEHIAKLNKILFDAHIAAGFDGMDAVELTCAYIGSILV